MKMEKQTYTQIQVTTKTRQRLKDLKQYNKESYDEIINRIIDTKYSHIGMP